MTDRGAATDLGRDPDTRIDRPDLRDEPGCGRPRRGQRADGIEPDGGPAHISVEEFVEAGGTLPSGQSVERGHLVRGQECAGRRVVDDERALDPVDPFQRIDPPGVRIDRPDVVEARRGPGDVGQDDDRCRFTGGELGLERHIRIAALDAGRVDLSARDALDEAKERAAGDEQDGQGRDQHRDRAAHDTSSDPLPACRAGDLHPIGDRPEAVAQAVQRPGVHPMAEQAEDGGQEGQREHDRAQDDQRPGDPDGPNGRRLEQQQAGQADGDGHAAECDGLAGGRHGAFDGVPDGSSAPQLLAESTDDEQGVIDREGETQHRRDIQDEDAHLDLLGDDVDQGEARGDRESRHEQGHPGRHDRGEDEDEHDGDDRQGDDLRLLEILLGLRRGVLRDRPVTGQLDRVASGRLDRGPDGVDHLDGVLVGQVQLDDEVGGIAALADETRVARLGMADDADHIRNGREAGGRGRDGGLESRGCRIGARHVRAEERDDRTLSRPEFGVEASRHAGRLGVGIEPATRRQGR